MWSVGPDRKAEQVDPRHPVIARLDQLLALHSGRIPVPEDVYLQRYWVSPLDVNGFACFTITASPHLVPGESVRIDLRTNDGYPLWEQTLRVDRIHPPVR